MCPEKPVFLFGSRPTKTDTKLATKRSSYFFKKNFRSSYQNLANLHRSRSVPHFFHFLKSEHGCEGKLYHNDDTGAVYIALDGFIRHVPDSPTYNALFSTPLDASRMIRIHNFNLNVEGLNEGSVLPSGAQLIRDDSNGAVYLIDNVNGQVVKRHITSPAQMDKYHFNWGRVVHVTNITASAIKSGKSIEV